MTGRVAWIAAGVVGVAVWIALAAWNPSSSSEDTVCLLRSTTGASCPGCGFGRAAAAGARFDLPSSLRLHPMAPVVALQAVGIWLAWGAVRAGRIKRPPDAWMLWLLGANVAAFVAVWAIRALVGALPP